MALLTRADGLQTGATGIASFEGIIELQFTLVGGDVKTLTINSNKFAKSLFTIPEAGTASATAVVFNGFRVLGSGYAITGTAQANGNITTDFFNVSALQHTIFNGVGKVDFGVDADDLENNQLSNVKNVSFLIGRDPVFANFALQQGAILFIGNGNGDATTIHESGTALTEGTFVGGTGTAIIRDTATGVAAADVSKVVRLDDITYPFTVASGDNISIEPIGSSIILI